MATTKKPMTSTRSDADIVRDLHHKMKADLKVPDDRVQAKVSGGVVTLLGTVRHDEEKSATEDCARKVTGVCEILNRIQVDASSSLQEG